MGTNAYSTAAAAARSAATAGRRALVALLCVLLAACGARFLYNRLDTLLYLYFSAQVELQAEQRSGLRTALREFLLWHRHSELPRYAGYLDSLALELQRPIGRERIDAARLEIESWWRSAVARAAPDAARWLASLRAQQLDELFASFAEDDDELNEEFCEAPAARRNKKRTKQFVALAEDWVGDLSLSQRALVRQSLVGLTPTGCGFIENRLRFRGELRALVDRRAQDPEFPVLLVALMSRPEERWAPQYRADFEANRDRVVWLIAELDASLAPEQRQHLVRRLQAFGRDFRELAAQRRTAR